MLKKVLSIIFIFFGLLVNAQTDSSSVVPAAPAETVNKASKEKKARDQTPPALGEVFQPKIALGAGLMSFHGDLYSRH
jgi:hypothetical protein